MIRLSVIIPTFNRKHVLARTLPALFAQDLPPEDYEVIVVMDGSTDGTDEFLRGLKPQCALRVLEAPHRGAGAARNVGIKAAVGELVLFLDDDIIAAPDLLSQHCASHLGSEPQVIHGPIYIAPDSSQSIIRYVTELYYEEFNRSLKPGNELRYPIDFGSSIAVLSSVVNSSLPRKILLESGGFDEQLLAAEDLELGLRLWRMGIPFHCPPDAITYELYTKSSWDYLRKQAKALGAGDLRASRKIPEYRRYSVLAPFANTRPGKKWLRNVLMRSPLSPVPLIAFPLRFEKWFYRYAPLRKIGVGLMRTAERITRLRSGLSAAGSWKTLNREFGRCCPALMYHHVGPSRPGTYAEWTISPARFERQIRWLARNGYVGITPSQWLRWRREGVGIPEKPVLLSFDDAYADTAEYALPILRRYGFGAVVYVVTQRIGKTNTWDEAQGCGTLQVMTAEQIRLWAAQGIEFGAHSRTHADLTELSEAECLAEIAGSKSDLAALLGSPVISFAYPYGESNDAVCDVVRSEYDLAFGVDEGMNYLRGDPHLLRRTYIGPNDSLFEFAYAVREGELKKLREWRGRLRVRTRLKKALQFVLRTGSA